MTRRGRSVAADFDVGPGRLVPGELGGAARLLGLDVDDHVLDRVGGLVAHAGGGLVGGAEVGAVAGDIDVGVVDDLGGGLAAQALLQGEQVTGAQVVGGAGVAGVLHRVLRVQLVLDVHAGTHLVGGRLGAGAE